MEGRSSFKKPLLFIAQAWVILLIQSCSNDAERQRVNAGHPLALTTVGSHTLVFQRMQSGRAVLETPALVARFRDGLLLVGVGRGDARAFDSPVAYGAERTAQLLGSLHAYSKYPQSGTGLYSITRANPAPATLQISTRTPPDDEITLAAVELSRSHVQDISWIEARPGKIFGRNTVRSGAVRTTGPATLVAFWWGDAGVRGEKTAVANDGFHVIDSVLAPGALVQCAVAVKEVTASGTYSMSWTATPRQSAQLWLVAVQ